MKILKKCIIVLLVVLMINSLMVVSPISALDILYRDYEYITSNGYVKITKYLGNDEEVIVPSEIYGEKVINIGEWSFRNKNNISSIILPSELQIINYSAFENCTSLTNITIPDSVVSIGSYAFENCTSLTSITIPDSVTEIGYRAFYNCENLSDVKLPDNYTLIGSSAFKNCPRLTSIKIPEKIKDLGYYSFGYNYDIITEKDVKIDSFIIYGYTNSEADSYAEDNGFIFFSTGVTKKEEVSSEIAAPKRLLYTHTVPISAAISAEPIIVETVAIKTIKAKKLKKRKIKIKVIRVSNTKGRKVTFKKLSGSKKLKINSKTGVITVKKGKYKKGKTLRIKIKITAKATSKVNADSDIVTIKIKIK